MPVLKKKPRYRLGGDLTVGADADGLPRRFLIGDEMPEEVLATLNQAEVDVMLRNGMLREIGAPPPARPAPEPPRRLTAVEILRNAGWWSATVEDGQVINGPRGYPITVLDRPASASDLKHVTGAHSAFETPVLVHRVGDELVATLPLAKLASRLQMLPAR